MALSVDVVIPVRDRFELTASCLRHLAAQTRPHRVVVVDDNSTDGTPERLAREWPDVRVLGRSGGFAAVCNAGAAAGDGDVVVLLNNDVDCRPDFLAELLAPLERDTALGSVAALSLRPGEREIDSVGLTGDVTLSAFPRLRGRPVAEAGAQRPVLTGPAGNAGAYRRSAWAQVGGLDETFTAYHEDFELALRLRAAGWETVAAPTAVCVHLGSATYGRRSAWQRRHGGFGRGYVIGRYRLLRGAHGPRTALTEAIAVAGDALLARDLAGARGRWAGFRTARALPPRARPDQAVDAGISLRESLALRTRS